MMEENEIARKVENLFESGGGDEEGMWNILSKFAPQFDELQILGLTKLTYVAKICSENVQARLLAFRDHYIALHSNKDTAMYMLRMMEAHSLKQWVNGIQGQVIKTDK